MKLISISHNSHTASPHRDAFLCLLAKAAHQFVQVCATAILAGQLVVETTTEVADVALRADPSKSVQARGSMS